MKNSKEYLDHLRHSCAHLLAAAVLELYPKAKLAIGPSIENGFYYDIDFGDQKLSEEDLPILEKKMAELAPSWESFEKKELTAVEAKAQYKSNPYKEELIDLYSENGKNKIGFYLSKGSTSSYFDGRPYWDLCKGGHVDDPKKELKHFKLLSVAGAYWHGDEKNKMLTRIYGTIFPTKDELQKYLTMLEEAEKRNHKKLGQELRLFMFHETAPGMAYWLPKGVVLYNELVNFWRIEHQKEGYQEIFSPLINKKELYETSGHWDHYKENMFLSETEEGEIYAMKPMNCPNAMVVFGSETRSYRDLPLRLSDTDMLHRYEKSGTLNGLLRIREFRQDDAHIFIEEGQISEEYERLFKITEKFYSIFGLKYEYRLGTRPENFMGEPKLWDKAEKELKEILKKSGKEFTILEGDGAFYGPKIDIMMKDSLGREWQMGTLQLDFQQPLRFGLKYSASDGSLKTPVAIHRVIYGSLERFIGILIEDFGGNFPIWITPVQVKILPITDRNLDYAQRVSKILMENGIRTEVDERNETLGAKIRDAQSEKVSYMLIVGDKEEKSDSVAARSRSGKDYGSQPLELFVQNIKKEISEKTIN
jgi:threonyl-tRNA synthetase